MRQAQTKYSEALANDIAAALNAAPQAAGRVTVTFNKAADTWAVNVRAGRDRYQLLMPAPGAMYALFRNGAWLGGMNTNTGAAPVDVALTLLDRIAATAR